MMNVDMRATCRALVSMQLYISIYKKTIVHNDFNNFCNTMNKVCMQVVLERDYEAASHVFSST